MPKALVQVGDASDDPAATLPRHGDVILLVEDDYAFGSGEMEQVRIGRWRLASLPGPITRWSSLLGRATIDGALPMYRNFYLTDKNRAKRRAPVPAPAGR